MVKFEMRLIDYHVGPTGIELETYVLHEPGDPYAAILQVELFRGPMHDSWHAWTGSYWGKRAELAKECAKRRNEEEESTTGTPDPTKPR